MQNSLNIDETLPLKSLVSHRIFEAVKFSYKLKPHRNGHFNIVEKPVEVTYTVTIETIRKNISHISK